MKMMSDVPTGTIKVLILKPVKQDYPKLRLIQHWSIDCRVASAVEETVSPIQNYFEGNLAAEWMTPLSGCNCDANFSTLYLYLLPDG